MRALLSCAMLASARAFARFGRAAPLLRGRALRAATGSGSYSYEMVGTLSKIGENQTFESGFNKVEFVVTTDEGLYPQDIKDIPYIPRNPAYGSRTGDPTYSPVRRKSQSS